MLPKSFIKGFDTGRLKGLLAVFFLALAVPTGVLIWQAYGQLKWEAFHQYRGVAEGLSNRIDSVLMTQLETAEARSFADYTFLVVAGDQKLNFVQRSPLSEFPVAQDQECANRYRKPLGPEWGRGAHVHQARDRGYCLSRRKLEQTGSS